MFGHKLVHFFVFLLGEWEEPPWESRQGIWEEFYGVVPNGVAGQSLGGFFVEYFLMAMVFLGNCSFFGLVMIGGVDRDTSDEVLPLIGRSWSVLFS